MANPTTRSSTPPASGRIAQQAPTSAVILQGYADTAFPGIAFTYQLAIDLTGKTLAYYDTNGAWQQLLSGADVQSYYGPVAPTIGMQAGDRWWDTANLIWNTWDDAQAAWMPGATAYSTIAPDNPDDGQPWFNTATRQLRYWDAATATWVLGTDPLAPTISSGTMPDSADVGDSWTDSDGVSWTCITAYASGLGDESDWERVVYHTDRLARLIRGNGQVIVAKEATSSPPTPQTTVTITSGLIWLDFQVGSPRLGNFYVYNGTAWKRAHALSTIDLCLALLAARRYVQFRDTDKLVAGAAGAQVLRLSTTPIDGSLHVRWNGLDQPTTDWSLIGGRSVLFSNTHVHVGDTLDAAYAYYVSNAASTVTARLIPGVYSWGTFSGSGGAGNPIPLPAGTQIGDLIVLSAISDNTITITDARLTSVGNNMWIGWANNLSAITVGLASPWYALAVETYTTNASGWTAPQVASNGAIAIGGTIATPVVSGVAAALCTATAIVSGFGTCAVSTPTGYTNDVTTGNPLSAAVNLWTAGSTGSSPSGTITYTGGNPGGIYATTVGLIGPVS